MKQSTKQSLIWGAVLVIGIVALVIIGLQTGAVDPSAAS